MSKTNEHPLQRRWRTWPEYLALYGSAVLALGALIGAVAIAISLDDAHWVNRGGAAMAGLQSIAAAGEYRRRNRLHHLLLSMPESEFAVPSKIARDQYLVLLQEEIARSERHAFVLVLALAGVGELIHGFGDLLIERLLCSV